MADESEQIFEHYQVASWTVGGRTVAFPVHKLRECGGSRIVERERPYRQGAKLDDTGSKATRWTCDVEFNNSIDEPGLEQNGFPLYPDALNELIASFAVRETGDAVIPTVGRRRCKIESYDRVEEFGARDVAVVCFTFVEDNEDAVDFRQPEPPSANASALRLSDFATFSAQTAGAWHPTIAAYRTAMSRLSFAANRPGEVADDVRGAADAVVRSSQDALAAFQRLGDPRRDQLAQPRGSRAERRFVQSQDVAQRAAGQARTGEPQLARLVFAFDVSLFDVAASVGQPLTDLLDLNAQLDPTFVPAGTVVRVRAA